MTGPLDGLRVLEFAGVGPVPHAAMVLADLGADVVRVERPDTPASGVDDQLMRSRRRVVLDLKSTTGPLAALGLAAAADVLLEGFRPGVAERLGLGPDVCLARNPRLVYGRMTGWGQAGPFAGRAGHDINYISVSGALHAIGRAGQAPVPPLNLVGDFGGGSMLLVAGVLAAVVERQISGRGQVVDAAMVDGASVLLQLTWSALARGGWTDERGRNLLDGGAPFYDTYLCADQRYVAVGALEPRFFAALLAGLGLSAGDVPDQWDTGQWPLLRSRLAAAFASRPRDEWAAVFGATDACVTPVLAFGEVGSHPHIAARGTVINVGGVLQAAPAPRFSRTPAADPRPPGEPPLDPGVVAADWSGREVTH
jgi:alpha-methylacyl-CoA racemase